MKHEEAKRNLKDIAETLDYLNCHWWAEAGTCLGAIREGGFIDHDTDIDVGLTDTDKVWYLARELMKKGFALKHDFGTIDNGFEFSWMRHGVKTDFFFFYRDGDIMWHSAWDKGKQLFLDFPAYLFKDLKTIEFKGFNIKVPNPPEEYLEKRYGDWKTPVKNWDWANDPLCLRT